jgi:transcriptional regulator with XRE-family HTH domain
MATMGRLLKTARVGAGYDRPEDFAHLVGKSSRQVREYEKDTVVPPSDVLQKWAAATGKPLEYFLPSPEPPPAPPASQYHPGVEALADDPQTCEQWAVKPEELDRLRQSRWPQPITDPKVALRLALAWR